MTNQVYYTKRYDTCIVLTKYTRLSSDEDIWQVCENGVTVNEWFVGYNTVHKWLESEEIISEEQFKRELLIKELYK